jgi:hypothetical protein
VLLRDVPERRELTTARVGEEHVDATGLLLHRGVEPVEIGQIGDVAADTDRVVTGRRHRRVELGRQFGYGIGRGPDGGDGGLSLGAPVFVMAPPLTRRAPPRATARSLGFRERFLLFMAPSPVSRSFWDRA